MINEINREKKIYALKFKYSVFLFFWALEIGISGFNFVKYIRRPE
jgi:hypothetical protein